MHVGHLVLVEAESAEQAVAIVTDKLEDGSATPWSDWHQIGGRWSDEFGGETYAIPFSDLKAKEALEKFLDYRTNSMKEYLEKVKNFDLEDAVSNYDPKSKRSYGEDTMSVWYLRKLAEILNDEWQPDSYVFDAEYWSGNLKAFYERCELAPEMQFMVIVDFHF